MHRLFEKLKPAFFRAWDQELILNRPALWATKFHYALMFGLLGLALSSLAVWLLPIELSAVPNAWSHMFYAAIPSVIGLAIWIWQVSLFRTDKAFGEAGIKIALRDQMIYGLIVLMAIGLPALHGYRVSQKVAQSVDEAELIKDINHLNLFEGFTSNYTSWGHESESLEKRMKDYSFHYYTDYAALDDINDSEYNSGEFVKLTKSQHQAELLEGLQGYVNLLSQYSSTPFLAAAEDIYQKFRSRENGETESIKLNDTFTYAENEAETNLMKLQEAKKGESHIFGDNAWKGVAMIFLWTFGLLLIGLQTNARSFLISAVFGGVILAGGVLLSESLSHFFGVMRTEGWLSSIHLVVMLLFGLLVLRRKTTHKGILWRQVILTLFVVGLAFLPMTLWQIVYELNQEFFFTESFPGFHRVVVFESFLIGGTTLPILFWNLGLRQSFVRLHVRPKTR